MYSFLLNLHSGFRYIVTLLVLIAIIQSLMGWFGKRLYTETNRKINLFAFISAHIQLLIGLILYFVSPNVVFSKSMMTNDVERYWTMEHITMMIFAIALITFGYIRSKKIIIPAQKHRTIAIYYLLAILVIFLTLVQGHIPFFGMK
jgi:hypothetical protein